MTAKIYAITTGNREVSSMEFLELIETFVEYAALLDKIYPNRVSMDKVAILASEMRSNVDTPGYRDELTQPLEELLDEMFIDINR